jgi:hypothetical protein
VQTPVLVRPAGSAAYLARWAHDGCRCGAGARSMLRVRMLGCADCAHDTGPPAAAPDRRPGPAPSRCRRPVTVTAACQCVATVIEIRDRGCVLGTGISCTPRPGRVARLRPPARRPVVTVTVHDRISAVLHDRISAVLHRTSAPTRLPSHNWTSVVPRARERPRPNRGPARPSLGPYYRDVPLLDS